MSADLPLPDVTVTTRPKTHETTRMRRQPPYNVIIENDDYHSFEFVIGVLMKVLGCPFEKARQLTLQAHNSGRAVVWTGTREVAELKLEQILTFHEIRESDGTKFGPLGCCIEPAPGA